MTWHSIPGVRVLLTANLVLLLLLLITIWRSAISTQHRHNESMARMRQLADLRERLLTLGNALISWQQIVKNERTGDHRARPRLVVSSDDEHENE